MKKSILFSMVLFSALLFSPGSALAATTSSITQYGITWTFDKAYEYGQWANGDYWVKTDVGGSVVITRMEPDKTTDADGKVIHGYDVNCNVYNQGFDQRSAIAGWIPYTSSRTPAFLYAAPAGVSILNAISMVPCESTSCYPGLTTAAVLTVVGSTPANNGATIFRPPYIGTRKPLTSTATLHMDRLPSLAPVANTPSLASQLAIMKYMKMDHLRGNNMKTRPLTNMDKYGAGLAQQENNAILRLMLNDSTANKLPLAIAVVQAGIDYYYFMVHGQTWPAGGGEQPGRISLPLFASYLLDDATMQAKVGVQSTSPDARYPSELENIRDSRFGVPLYGNFGPGGGSETVYWNKLEDPEASGSSTIADPYRYIDGGCTPGAGYDYCCVAEPWKGLALIRNLMPGLKTIWNFPDIDEYVERWVNHGTWTQPDPCAPVGGTRGVDYGPDPANPGMCIKDPNLAYYNSITDFACTPGQQCGRKVSFHGTNADGGLYRSAFVDSMWNAYSGTSSQTCSQLGGSCCSPGQACTGSFPSSSNCGSLCCVGGPR